MEIAAGIVLASLVVWMTSINRMDRDRVLYPVVLIVVASYYALFAVMAGSTGVLAREAVPICIFVAASLLGFRYSLWLVAIALVAHGVFDVLHGRLISNPGVPAWWPGFCLAFDVAAGFYLAWLLKTNRVRARAPMSGG